MDAFLQGVEPPQQLPPQQQPTQPQQRQLPVTLQQPTNAHSEPDIAFHSLARTAKLSQELQEIRRQIGLLQPQASSQTANTGTAAAQQQRADAMKSYMSLEQFITHGEPPLPQQQLPKQQSILKHSSSTTTYAANSQRNNCNTEPHTRHAAATAAATVCAWYPSST